MMDDAVEAARRLISWYEEPSASPAYFDSITVARALLLVMDSEEGLREALMKVKAKIAEATIASCECLTKTPDPLYHAQDCRYRMLAHALNDIEAALASEQQ